MPLNLPQLDDRTYSQLVQELQKKIPHYTPEWTNPAAGDPGTALLKIFARFAEQIIHRMNQVPRKNMTAFLDMLGIKLLPAQSARVPLTFQLSAGIDREVFIPAFTRAAAGKTEAHEELPFETEKNLLATPSRLLEIIAVQPETDQIYVHTPALLTEEGEAQDPPQSFLLFGGVNLQEHSIFLAHSDLFNMDSRGEISVEILLSAASSPGLVPLETRWEYWGEDKEAGSEGWLSLQILSDETGGFSRSGLVQLYKSKAGGIKQTKLQDIFRKTGRPAIQNEDTGSLNSRWLRCRIEQPLPAGDFPVLPETDTIKILTRPEDPLPPEAGFSNDVPQNWKAVQASSKHAECSDGPVVDVLFSTAAVLKRVCVESAEKFVPGDAVEIIHGSSVFETTIAEVNYPVNRLGLSDDLPFEAGDTIQLKSPASLVLPFGEQPRVFDSFFLASREVFSKKDAEITLNFTLQHIDTSAGLTPPPNPRLSWEYWNGSGWQPLTISKDETGRFLTGGEDLAVEFICPPDFVETEINGQSNYWLRVRLAGGDFGREVFSTSSSGQISSIRQFKLPVIRKLGMSYHFIEKKDLQHCLAYNNLEIKAVPEPARSAGQGWQPFALMADENPALYLGFEQPLRSGPIRLFFDAREIPFSEADKPEVVWEYHPAQGWKPLDFLDETEGFIHRGQLELLGPADFTAGNIFGRELFWIRGRQSEGIYQQAAEIANILLNTTWAVQAQTISNEIVGSSDGQPGQTFQLFKFPVHAGEEIRVRELLSEEEKQVLLATAGPEVIYEMRDENGRLLETWVRWQETGDFLDSGSESRHYLLDRAGGSLQFGDGVQGKIPPPGNDNIQAFRYQAGGGKSGNVEAGEIKMLKSSVAGVDGVINPIAADGGAETATLDEMLKIGPARIRHRNRAVTVSDFESLARQASRKIAKVKCLPKRGTHKDLPYGFVHVVIVPDVPDPQPSPSLELRRRVQNDLRTHASLLLISPERILVDGPEYCPISVRADIYLVSLEAAAETERSALRALNDFFHPLTGGPEKSGWDFGRRAAVSDVYALLENLDGVDHVENLQLTGSEGRPAEDIVVGGSGLIANGLHELNFEVA
ncbi:MAG: putative baseplate assembly protein [Calditrichia bacterium]